MADATNLELKIARLDQSRYRVVLLRLEDLGGDSTESELATLAELDANFFSGLIQHRHNPTETGKLLLQHLAPQALRDALQQAFGASLGTGLALRLRLVIDDERPELHRLPWEMLLPVLDQAFGAVAQVAFSRYIRPASLLYRRLRPRAPLRTLVVTASPADLDPQLPAISAATELERVRQALGARALIASLPLTAQSTRARLQAALVRHVDGGVTDLLCIIAHGKLQESYNLHDGAWVKVDLPLLLLEQDNGTTDHVSAEQIAELVQQAPALPRLVILGSCESAGNGYGDLLRSLGSQLARLGIPAVVAMQDKITQATFEAFLHAFLRELNHSGQADRAMAAARAAISAFADWWVPVLFQSTRQGRIWAEDDAELRQSVLAWLQRQPIVPTPEARSRLAQAILACPVVRDLDWTILSGFDALIDIIEASPADAPALAELCATIAEVLPAGPVSYAEARELRRLLREVRLFANDMSDLYGRVKPRGPSWKLPVLDDQPGRLAAAVTPLAWAQPETPGGLPPLALLVDELLRHYQPFVAPVALALATWRARVAPHQPPRGDPPPPTPREAYLQVQLRAGRKLTGQARFSCVGWLCYADDSVVRPQSRQFGDLHVQHEREHLPAVFRELVREAMRQLPPAAQDLRIEVFVPRSLLLLELDEWPLDHGESRSARAGMKYQLVVRALERVQSERGAALRLPWQRKWARLCDCANDPACTRLHWIENAASGDPDALLGQLFDDDMLGISQTWHPTPNDDDPQLLDMLDDVLGTGAPVALIVRPSATLPPVDRAVLEARLQGVTLIGLPEAIRTWRRKHLAPPEQFGRRLTLLWDDPERLPPSIQYTNVE
jgi:hypothetical protein